MAEFIRVAVSSIHIGERLRPIDMDYAEAIAASMSEHGQISPIMIRKTPAKKGTPYTLVAGGYRTTAATLLGWTEIDSIVVKADAVEAQLLEISENLYRNELNPLDRAIFVMKYRELWEEKHGEIKRGRPSEKNRNDYGIIFSGGRELSERVKDRFGFGQSTYEKVTSIGKNLDPVLRQAVRGTTAENDQSQLLDVYNALLFAQVTSGFIRVTLPAGSGKTTAAKHFLNTRPHVFMATLSPSTKTVHGMLVELCAALEVHEHNPARFVRSIGAKLKRVGEGSLLIIDEAQNAVPEAINQLRHFVDNDHCGVALLGNEDTATAFIKDLGRSVASRAQVLSRFDRQVRTARNPAADAAILIKAWGVEEGTDCATFLKGIASKPGALRQIDRTMKAASMLAIGDGEEGVRLEHLQAAWKNRDMGDSL